MIKKILTFILTLLIIVFLLQIKIYAASIPLNSVNVTTSKDKIAPGEEVKVNIEFGTDLGAYTFDIAYDNNIFEYVSTDGGTENNDGTRVRVVFYDSSGGTNPRTNMSVTFKAKESLTTTNPTNFSVTAEGLANADASQEYDDITTAIEKEVTVEPRYEEYEMKLDYSGKIVENKDKDLKLITTSKLGKNYDNVMLKVEVLNKPENANIRLTAIDESSQEVDLLQDGWGAVNGYSLGGSNVRHELNMTGNFDKIGEYTIKFSILDKDNSDAVIVEKELKIDVSSESLADTESEDNSNENNTENNQGNLNEEQNEEKLPNELPKTGMTQYAYIATMMFVLISGYIVTKNYKKDK